MTGSDKNTRDGRVRVTYIDEADVIETIQELAEEERLTASDIIRRATWQYIQARKRPGSGEESGPLQKKRARKR
jgi:hypothetical protein